MPLLNIRTVQQEAVVATWHITESELELYEPLAINSTDQFFLNEIHHPIKRLEFLAGRLLVKTVLEQYGKTYNGIHKIKEKPHLPNLGLEMSLTHSFPYVAVIFHPSLPVGIDIEKIKEKIKVIAERFLTPEELLFTKDDIQKLTICWCVKEALYKIHSEGGVLFRENFFVEPFGEAPGCIQATMAWEGYEKKYTLYCEFIEGYIMCYGF